MAPVDAQMHSEHALTTVKLGNAAGVGGLQNKLHVPDVPGKKNLWGTWTKRAGSLVASWVVLLAPGGKRFCVLHSVAGYVS